MLWKLCTSLIPSHLKVIWHLCGVYEHNLYSNFVIFFEICKNFLKDFVNGFGYLLVGVSYSVFLPQSYSLLFDINIGNGNNLFDRLKKYQLEFSGFLSKWQYNNLLEFSRNKLVNASTFSPSTVLQRCRTGNTCDAQS